MLTFTRVSYRFDDVLARRTQVVRRHSSWTTVRRAGLIPKILHQIYNMSARERGLRPDYAAYRQSWLDRHPHWEHRYWDHESVRALIAAKYPGFLPTYDAYPFFIQRCDAARYCILHHEGGLYVDMDIENLKSVDDLFEDNELSLFRLARGYSNAAMASAPGHPLWQHVLHELPRRAARPRQGFLRLRQPRTYYISSSTGPIFLTNCIESGRFDRLPDTRIHPGYVFEPLAPAEIDGKIERTGDTSRSYAIHHMSLHWLSPAERAAQACFAPIARAFWAHRRYMARHARRPASRS